MNVKAIIFASLIGVASIAYADNDGEIENKKNELYQTIGNYTDDLGNVYVFFSYSCAYCRTSSPAFTQWIKTVPVKIKARKIPIVSRNNVAQAAAYFAANKLDKSRVEQFEELAYQYVIDKGYPVDRATTYQYVARDAGYDVNKFIVAMTSSEAKKYVEKCYALFYRYRVEYTPSVGMFGKYLLDVEHVGGRIENVFTLMNGLGSQYLRGN